MKWHHPSTVTQDADDRGEDAEDGLDRSRATVSFSALYDALGRGLTNERSVLLLYALLYGSLPFRVRLCCCYLLLHFNFLMVGACSQICPS